MAAVLRNFTNPYWGAMRDGLQDEAKKQGVTVDIQAGAGETDVDGVNANISTMANQDYNCFGVVPNNATNVITPLVPLARKKTPIMSLDTKADWTPRTRRASPSPLSSAPTTRRPGCSPVSGWSS